MEFYIHGKKNQVILATNFLPIFHLHCYSQVDSIFTFIAVYSVKLLILKCLRSIETENLLVTIVVPKRQSLVLLATKESYSAGILFSIQYPNFSTKSRNDMSYHIPKKNIAPKPDATFKCKLCAQGFAGIYDTRQHKDTQHGFPIKWANVDNDNIINEMSGLNLKGELRSGRHFLLDSELERARNNVFKHAVENLNETIVSEKLDWFFNILKCAAKKDLAFELFFKNVEDGGFRCLYIHKETTLFWTDRNWCKPWLTWQS